MDITISLETLEEIVAGIFDNDLDNDEALAFVESIYFELLQRESTESGD